MGILIITHHDKLLEHNTPDFTHVMLGGRIVETGGVELARELYTEGYDRVRARHPEDAAVEREMVADTAHQRRRVTNQRIKIMATDLLTPAPHDTVGEINKYDFITPTTASSTPARAQPRGRCRDFRDEERAGLDARFPARAR